MWEKINITVKTLAVILLSIFLLGIDSLFSQETKSEIPYEASFIRSNITQRTGELTFNVVKITNNTDSAVRIQPILDLPKGWAIFTTAFVDTVIQANSSINLSFRFRTSNTAKSNIEHQINFKGYIKKTKTVIESSFAVKLEELHSWDIIIPEKRVFFYPKMNIANFKIVAINNGNTTEAIQIEIVPDAKITIEGTNNESFRVEFELPPNTDTTFSYNASYTYSEDRVFDISKVQILASTEARKIYRSVLIEKYSDTYSPFEIDRNLAHETELGIRTFSNNKKMLPFVKARGNADFKNESSLRYNFTYFDLTKTENVIQNSYYNFLYTWNKLNVGLGAFSSQLGRNLYSRNSVMVSDIAKLSDYSSIEGYASYNLTSPKTSLAAGYNFNNENLNILGSVAYDVDGHKKINTASLVLNSGRITFAKNNDINVVLYGYHESHYLTEKYQQYGYAWDINYFGKISKPLSFHFTNNYGSPDIPGPQMGLLNFFAKLKYNLGTKLTYITANYINSTRDYYNIDTEGRKMPMINLSDKYGSLMFHSNSGSKVRWYLGPSIEFYHSSSPVPNSTNRIIYNIQKYRMEFKGYFGRSFIVTTKFGIGESLYQAFDNLEDLKYDFHLLTDYNKNGYGLRVSYDYGPMVNNGLYQYAMDAGNNSINISPYLIRTYLQTRIAVSLFTNYTYRFDLDYGSLNINPKIETYIYKDWYVVIGGTYNYTQQRYDKYDSQKSFYYLEFSIKKRWGKKDYNKWQKDLRRVQVHLFKDSNANGKMDNHEKGIINAKVRLQITNVADQTIRNNFPVDITLMTNEKGIVTFNRIPKGFYSINIIPLSDLEEYFYVNSNTEQIEVIKNASYYIPFQKASKISGKINVVRQKYKNTEKKVDLANVKVTAYNNEGNSYSSFTTKDGKFTIYAPGNYVYTIRIKNVFGNSFKILKNDLKIMLTDTTSTQIVFNIVEQNRKIKLKKATPSTVKQDASKLQKIKVLPGKIYENSSNKAIDKNAIPEFSLPDMPIKITEMEKGQYYIIAGQFTDFKDAEKLIKIFNEQGVKSYVGADDKTDSYYVYVAKMKSKQAVKKKLLEYKTIEMRPLTIIKY